MFLSAIAPGPTLARIESYINGVPMIQSTGLELGRDFTFKLVMKARLPGRHHVHPMLNVEDAGSIVGPGSWVEISGDADDFVLAVTTLTGVHIENLETWGVETVIIWHLIWVAIAVFWLLWWLRRPLLMPRYMAKERGREDVLITRTDMIVTAVLMVVTIGLVIGGYQWVENKYPRTIRLQGGRATVEPLPISKDHVALSLERAEYDVPGRSMRLVIRVSNETPEPVQLGEFTTANVRFMNPAVAAARANLDADYPEDLVFPTSLTTDNDDPIAPGETRTIRVDATDAAWETERLTSLLNDPDSRLGGLFFFFDAQGNRYITSVYGPVIPKFLD